METNINNLNEYYNMNKIFIFAIIGIIGALSTVQHINAQIFEDQFIVCNFESVCTVIDIDDFMNKEKSDLIWSLMENNIDTFKMGDLEN